MLRVLGSAGDSTRQWLSGNRINSIGRIGKTTGANLATDSLTIIGEDECGDGIIVAQIYKAELTGFKLGFSRPKETSIPIEAKALLTDAGLGVIFSIPPDDVPESPVEGTDSDMVIRIENQDSVTIQAGDIIAVTTGGGLLASASNNTKNAIGVAKTVAAVGDPFDVVTDGVIDIADWTHVVGTALLTPNQAYWLSTTAGNLTTTPPNTDGQIVQYIGRGLSTTQLLVEIDSPIKL